MSPPGGKGRVENVQKRQSTTNTEKPAVPRVSAVLARNGRGLPWLSHGRGPQFESVYAHHRTATRPLPRRGSCRFRAPSRTRAASVHRAGFARDPRLPQRGGSDAEASSESMTGSSPPGNRWPQRSKTVATDRWPAHTWTCLADAPWAIHNDTAVRRRSCIRRPTRAARSVTSVPNRARKEPARIGTPSAPVKTKPPSSRSRVACWSVAAAVRGRGTERRRRRSSVAPRSAGLAPRSRWSQLGPCAGRRRCGCAASRPLAEPETSVSAEDDQCREPLRNSSDRYFLAAGPRKPSVQAIGRHVEHGVGEAVDLSRVDDSHLASMDRGEVVGVGTGIA